MLPGYPSPRLQAACFQRPLKNAASCNLHNAFTFSLNPQRRISGGNRAATFAARPEMVVQNDVNDSQGVYMNKLRPGIEFPIIPEDFIDTVEELNLDMMESYLRWAYRCLQEGLEPADWTLSEAACSLCPEG